MTVLQPRESENCSNCGETAYKTLTISVETWRIGEESGQFECTESEYVEDLPGAIRLCAECNEPWPR